VNEDVHVIAGTRNGKSQEFARLDGRATTERAHQFRGLHNNNVFWHRHFGSVCDEKRLEL
jgi:hypothetical protein